MAKEREALLYQIESSPGSGAKGCLVGGSLGVSRHLLATQSTGRIPATGSAQLRGLLHSISGSQSQNWCFEQEEDLCLPCFSLYMTRVKWSGRPRVVHSQKRQLGLRSDLDRSLKFSGPQFLHQRKKE